MQIKCGCMEQIIDMSCPMNSDILQNLGRKYLKSFASGIAFMFASAADHFAWMAIHCSLPNVHINLLTLQITPLEFMIGRNINLAAMCSDSVLSSIKRLKPPAALIAAHLEAGFGSKFYVDYSGIERCRRAKITVALTDDRGKIWRVTHVERDSLMGE